MMFFVRMIRLIPLIAILLLVGLIIYLIAQARYNPVRAKLIVIKVFTWINCILLGFFLLACAYAAFEHNQGVLELFLSFAAVPAIGLTITLICKAVLYHHNPKLRHKAQQIENSITFKEFWKKKIGKFLKDYLNQKFGRR